MKINKDRFFWINVAIMILFFVLVCIGLVKTMNKADSNFSPPATKVIQ